MYIFALKWSLEKLVELGLKLDQVKVLQRTAYWEQSSVFKCSQGGGTLSAGVYPGCIELWPRPSLVWLYMTTQQASPMPVWFLSYQKQELSLADISHFVNDVYLKMQLIYFGSVLRHVMLLYFHESYTEYGLPISVK